MMKLNKLMMIMAVAALGVSTLASAQSVQPVDGNAMAATSNQGPKTREQVRAELAQARMDGSISRFGNPDPYGPGGTPNFTRH
jgi:transposase InsO family protein